MTVESELRGAAQGALTLAQRVEPALLPWGLYTHVYASGYQGGRPFPRIEVGSPLDGRFAATLEGAISRTQPCSVRVLSRGELTSEVECEGIRAYVASSEIVEHGEVAVVHVAALNVGASPGFISLPGRLGGAQGALSRVYFNATPGVAIRILSELTRELDRAAIHYQIKALANPSNYFRRDAVVLYVSSTALGEAVGACRRWLSARRIALKPGAPLLTHEIASGLSVADDPDDISDEVPYPRSHGTLIAWWLAQALEASSEVEGVMRAMRTSIEDAGRAMTAPHLRAGEGPRLASTAKRHATAAGPGC
jgi:HopA1 effector protein family